jgi:hypothetical protein
MASVNEIQTKCLQSPAGNRPIAMLVLQQSEMEMLFTTIILFAGKTKIVLRLHVDVVR